MNKLNWSTYEEITKNIYEQLGKKYGIKIIGFGNTCKRPGKSGVKHQIDVLTEHTDGLHNYITNIECKYWNQKINKDILMKVKEIQEDCNFQKSVVVSKIGFTEDAIKYGEYYNIGLVILREPTEEDWLGRTQSIVLQITSYYPQITNIEHKVIKYFGSMPNGNYNPNNFYYKTIDNNIEMSNLIESFIKNMKTENAGTEEKLIKSFDPPAILVNKLKGDCAEIQEVIISGKLQKSFDEMELNGKEYVWMIMKSLLENKTFKLSPEGKIEEVD